MSTAPAATHKGVGKGTGMGLATVYGIVKQNQGSIYVYSKPGQGTTFKIYWPVMNEESVVEKSPADDFSTGGYEVILLVEDDEALRSITARQLRQAGYTVIEAANGKEALEKARRHREPIDLLLTDVVMPGMGGLELSAAIKDFYPAIEVLIVSGYPDNCISRDISKLCKDILRRIRSLLDARLQA